MTDSLRHRGPDARGRLFEPLGEQALGLGHRRLSIIDTSAAAHQPLGNEDGSVQVVFNGEIYNFQELRDELAAKGHRFSSQSDTEVLVHLWEEEGPALVERLNGIFAFALWDRRQRVLLVARDPVGVKPLYYAWGSNGLIFGSQLAPLLVSGRVSQEIDRVALHDYLALNYVPGPRSILAAVSKLQPGHRLLLRPGGEPRVERYWGLRLASDPASSPTPAPPAEAARQLLEVLRRAVRRQMVSDVPLGMFLSGGIDSSTVLALMAEHSPRPVQAFTIDFAEEGYSEVEVARRTAQRFGAEHHVLRVGPELGDIPERLVESADEPFADSSAIPTFQLCRQARGAVTVALAGDGGDEVFAGYQTHRAHRYAEIYQRLPAALGQRLVPALIRRLPQSHGKIPWDFKARQFSRAAALPAAEAHFGFKEFLDEGERLALWEHPSPPRPSVELFRSAAAERPLRDRLDLALYLDNAIYLPDDILTKSDRCSMAVGLEARVPLLDLEVVEFAARIPSSWKLQGLEGKALLKRAMAGHLPAELLRRRKAGFNAPMAAWFAGPLGDMLGDLLQGPGARRLPALRRPRVEELLRQHRRGERELSRPLWALTMLLLWSERVLPGVAP